MSRFASHPSSIDPGWGPLQSANPGLHVKAHWPPRQLPDTAFAVEHAARQAPQCAALVEVFVSHPFAATPSQSPVPAGQLEH